METSFSFNIDPSYGVPLEEYLESNQCFSLVKYPVDRVLSAIKTITTNDPPEVISDATLEAVLSVAYYPEHLMILNLEFCLPLYDILATYLDHYTLLERSFGVLLMQVYGIFNMVEYLAMHHTLSAFVKSLTLSTRGVDVFHQLSLKTAQITGLDRDPSMNTMLKYYYKELSFGFRSSYPQSFLFGPVLLEHIFDARAEFSKAYSCVPGFGWALVLLKMWPELQSDRDKGEEPYKRLERLGQLRDLASRCLLVAPPHEQCIVGSLAWGIIINEDDVFLKDSFGGPKDPKDLEIVTCTLIRQLMTRPVSNTILGLKQLNTMSQYALHLVRMGNCYGAYPPILTAAYGRLWIELTSSPSDRYPVDHVAGYGFDLLGFTCEGCITSEMNFGSEGTTINIVSSLLRVDFINLLGRLLLSYTTCVEEINGEWVDQMISDAQNNMLILGESIAKYSKSLRSAFQPYYVDWLKILQYISQLSSMSLHSSRLLLPHLGRISSTWLQLGDKFGYSDHDQVTLTCSYVRCPGFKLVDCQSHVCGKCLYTMYCSVRCQQADWTCGSRPHSEVCGEHIRGIKLIEGI
ncbi:hypothetical protein BDV93DRAFT_527902 [Ceratobasidium sp. AG-I]|nr:hypothetical protein BDV93DRAFT_527902 [Ceratobasidium sp. AG-I]